MPPRTTGSTAPGSTAAGSKPADPHADSHANTVCLRGRVAAAPEERELPSGDRVVTARLIIARPAGPARQRQPVDVLDCVAWTPRTQRLVGGWLPGSVVEVEGAIRRRFRRSRGALTSRVEIEVSAARRVRVAPPDAVRPARPRRRA